MRLFGGRFLIGSYLQVTLMICFQEIHSQTVSRGSFAKCLRHPLSLECPENTTISISTASLGYSEDGSCQHSSHCNNMVNQDPAHMKYLKITCNGQRNCSFKATKSRVECDKWWWRRSSQEDTNFEYITYNCVIKPVTEQSTPAWSSGTESSGSSNGEARNPDSDNGQPTDADNSNNKDYQERKNDDAGNNMIKEIVMVTICAIILIAIISLVLICRRKKNNKKKLQVNAVEMSDVNKVKTNANADPKCNKQNPMPQSGNSSSNNRKECKTTITATHNPPDDTHETIIQENEDIDVKHPETELRMSRSNIYGVVQNSEIDEHSGASASNAESLIYCDVETMEPIKSTERDESTYQEACEWHPNQKKGATAQKAMASHMGDSSVHNAAKAGLDSYNKVKTPVGKSKNPIIQDEDTYKNIGEIEGLTQGCKISDSTPSPGYELMTPGIQEDIYANESELPYRLVSVSTAKGTSGSESSYCDMQSPRVRFKEEGEQILIENELYSH